MIQEYQWHGGLDVRGLAAEGKLSFFAETADPARRRTIFGRVGEIIYPVVFQHLTRRHEIDRGHFRCAAGIDRLEPECLDRFHDDAEAAVSAFIRDAKTPIHNIEGWATKRLPATSVDAHRRRRGARGALQRPRLTQWLIADLHDDPWLKRLALAVLDWVGVAHTAGADTWPLAAWADLRASFTGEQTGTEQAITADLEIVLAAIRRKPEWYAMYVERPLARKVVPVLLGQRTPAEPPRELPGLALVDDHEVDDARLQARADVAVSRLVARIDAGDPPRRAVAEVLREAFCSDTGTEELDRLPGSGPVLDELLDARLADPAVIDRVLAVLTDICDAARC